MSIIFFYAEYLPMYVCTLNICFFTNFCPNTKHVSALKCVNIVQLKFLIWLLNLSPVHKIRVSNSIPIFGKSLNKIVTTKESRNHVKSVFKAISIYRISLSTFCINVLVYVWKQKTSLCVKKSKKFENHNCCISSNVTRVTEGYQGLLRVNTG